MWYVVKTHKPSWTLHPNIIRTIIVSNVTNDVIYHNPLWTSYIVFECLHSPMYLSRCEIKQRLCHIVRSLQGFHVTSSYVLRHNTYSREKRWLCHIVTSIIFILIIMNICWLGTSITWYGTLWLGYIMNLWWYLLLG